MTAPPRSRWRSAVAEAIPARVTGTDPVSECDAGVPASPTPAPMKMYAVVIRAWRDDDHHERGREDGRACFERGVPVHVLEVLLADEHRGHERPEDDDSRARRDPE